MMRLGEVMQVPMTTFVGLAGIGDLIVTGMSPNSRNFRAGQQLGQGKTLAQVEADMGMVIEGVGTTKAVYQLSQDKQIDMPITRAIYQVLYEDLPIEEAITSLMTRDLKAED
jgi:glycerol-3-phosphate dehydrogenase (NAD(P)+)